MIDNIFTSDLSSQIIYSGLIINDMSDHLPIYQITEYAHCRSNKILYKKRRVVNEKNLAVLIKDLKETNWNTVIRSENVDIMYDTFSEKLTAKLTAILRYCEKQYYTDILDYNKGNIKETWKIMNSLINKQSKKKKRCCTEFNSNGHKISGDKNVANGFNLFFL